MAETANRHESLIETNTHVIKGVKMKAIITAKTVEGLQEKEGKGSMERKR